MLLLLMLMLLSRAMRAATGPAADTLLLLLVDSTVSERKLMLNWSSGCEPSVNGLETDLAGESECE